MLCMVERSTHSGHQARAPRVDGVECARADQRLDSATIDQPLVHAAAEVEQIAKRAPGLPRSDDRVDRRLAGALDATQPVTDALSVNGLEAVVRRIDVRRQHIEPYRM